MEEFSRRYHAAVTLGKMKVTEELAHTPCNEMSSLLPLGYRCMQTLEVCAGCIRVLKLMPEGGEVQSFTD
jgi:hypothetical protein